MSKSENENDLHRVAGMESDALKALRDIQDLPWLSDGSAERERRAGLYEAIRALEEGFHDRSELLELSTAAYRGPVELARRLRETEFGSKDFPRRCSFGAFLAHLFGDEGANGEYASAYVYAIQVIRPFIHSVH